MNGTHPASRDWLGVGMTAGAAAMFAFKGVLVKLAFAEGVGLAALLVVRFSLATPLFWMGFRNASAIRSLTTIDRRGWLYCLLAGICYFGSVYADFKAIELIPVGVERLLFFSYPVFLVFLSAAIFRIRPTWRQLSGLAVIQLGLVLVVGILESTGLSHIAWGGIGYALAAALCYAVFLLLAQTATRRMGSIAFTVLANTVTFLLVAGWFLVGHSIFEIEMGARALFYVWAIAIFCTVVPFFLLFEGIRRIGSTPAALISTTGPLMTVLAAVAILGESLSASQMVGMVLVLGGVVWLERPRHGRGACPARADSPLLSECPELPRPAETRGELPDCLKGIPVAPTSRSAPANSRRCA